MLDINIDRAHNIIYGVINNKLTAEDMDRIVPIAEDQIEKHGKVRWYLEMQDFTGWDAEALLKDLKFDVRHAGEYEKVAMVGDKDWQEVMTKLMKPFTGGEMKFYDLKDKEAAKKWVQA